MAVSGSRVATQGDPGSVRKDPVVVERFQREENLIGSRGSRATPVVVKGSNKRPTGVPKQKESEAPGLEREPRCRLKGIIDKDPCSSEDKVRAPRRQ